MSGWKTAPGILLLDNATGRPVGFKESDGDETFFPTLDAAQTALIKPDGSTLSVAGGGPITTKDEGVTLSAATTSIDFVGAGVVATNTGGAVTVTIPAGGGITASSTDTLTNKRITARSETVNAPGATPLTAMTGAALVKDNIDRATFTGVAANITSMTTGLTIGTPVNGDSLIYDFTDNGTPRTIAWGTSYESSTINLPTGTVAGVKLTVVLEWNAATFKLRCVGVS